ncbi:MAG: hypothetical protein HY271_05120 [Deltaproteobacteria bacterium]|nr:hypothetical protein [Deltaproteobacteria bacterium]
MRRHHRLALVVVLCTCVLLVQAGTSVRLARGEDAERVYKSDGRYNSEYIFATTRGLTSLDAPAALKVTLVPVTLVMDVALLPFEFVAGCF